MSSQTGYGPLPPGVDQDFVARVEKYGKRDPVTGGIDFMDYFKNNPGPETNKFVESMSKHVYALSQDRDVGYEDLDFSTLKVQKGETWSIRLTWDSSVEEVLGVYRMETITGVPVDYDNDHIGEPNLPFTELNVHQFRFTCASGNNSLGRMAAYPDLPSAVDLLHFFRLCIVKPLLMAHDGIFLPETLILSANLSTREISNLSFFFNSLPRPFKWKLIEPLKPQNTIPRTISPSTFKDFLQLANADISYGDNALTQGKRAVAVEAYKRSLSQLAFAMCLHRLNPTDNNDLKTLMVHCYRKMSKIYLALGAGRNADLALREAVNLVDLARNDLEGFLLVARAYQALGESNKAYSALWWSCRSISTDKVEGFFRYLRANEDKMSAEGLSKGGQLSREEKYVGGWMKQLLAVRKASPLE